MSSKQKIIILSPPLYESREEVVESRGHECGYCHGTGGFWGDRLSACADEWRECPVCEGCGKMDAEVTIKWKPNKQYKAK